MYLTSEEPSFNNGYVRINPTYGSINDLEIPPIHSYSSDGMYVISIV